MPSNCLAGVKWSRWIAGQTARIKVAFALPAPVVTALYKVGAGWDAKLCKMLKKLTNVESLVHDSIISVTRTKSETKQLVHDLFKFLQWEETIQKQQKHAAI